MHGRKLQADAGEFNNKPTRIPEKESVYCVCNNKRDK